MNTPNVRIRTRSARHMRAAFALVPDDTDRAEAYRIAREHRLRIFVRATADGAIKRFDVIRQVGLRGVFVGHAKSSSALLALVKRASTCSH